MKFFDVRVSLRNLCLQMPSSCDVAPKLMPPNAPLVCGCIQNVTVSGKILGVNTNTPQVSTLHARWLDCSSLWKWRMTLMCVWSNHATIARTVLEDICDKSIRIQYYCAVARLHGVWEKETEDLLREIEWINCPRCRVAPTVQHRPPVIG
jgi:hypothetical protein